MIDYSKLQKSLKHLELQYENYCNAQYRDELSELDKEGIAESTIQRFETCYDTLWKTLKRYLVEELGIPEVPNSPKPILRLAFENQLFASPIEQWLNYADTRVNTAHDYDEKKAAQCLALLNDFIDDAIGLYQTMTGNTWE
ncbi:HI0074 family nucleotidyltransferase substrate-binding subunit [Methylomonas sp. HW2-6]|uniref:HI0074 family nucleotidyltransferase substrate-binding subunit n=1 Tax=Methylomonas sp. HW2-6 TaxID=3376687 RepID=UPI00404239AA